MHSALIHLVRSYAACQLTTAHQRHPGLVPLVLETCSTQTITHLVDIIQTVSRMLFQSFHNGMDYTFILCLLSKEISVLAFLKKKTLGLYRNAGFRIISALKFNQYESLSLYGGKDSLTVLCVIVLFLE
jgi:hypothetical protein